MTHRNGNKVANQFILEEEGHGANGNFIKRYVFQSYDSVIVIKTIWGDEEKATIEVDPKWNYSKTTLKYFKQFMSLEHHSSKTIKKMLQDNEIVTVKNLN